MKKLILPLSLAILPVGLSAQLVLNEFLADPVNDLTGDANGDGTRDGSQDEFIELVNTSGGAVDVNGWSIEDNTGQRHIFESETIVADGQALVIFGGGLPTGTFGNAVVVTSSSGLLGLNNNGDVITIRDQNGDFITAASYEYGAEGGNNEALTLDPDLGGGSFVGHTTLGDGSLAFTPGLKNNGSPFSGDSLNMNITPASFSEGGGAGAATGTVTRSGDTGSAITVSLISSDETELKVTASVEIGVGQASANFTIDAVDDAEQDEEQTVIVTASAAGVFSGSFQVTVEDDEAPIPTIAMSADPASFPESGGTSTITIEVSVASDIGYTFDLVGDDSSELTVPASVTIDPMATMGTFMVSGVDDANIDGTQNVTITASDPNVLIESATVSVGVTDDEAFPLPDIRINEVRIDDPGTDDDEYVELYSATEDVELGRLFLVVIGDQSSGSGVVERVISLNGQTMDGNYFVVGSELMTLSTPDLVAFPNFLENSDNISILLVSDFSGAEGDDLDPDDDGKLDLKPWAKILDGVALVEEPNGDDGMGGFIAPGGTEWDYSVDLSIPAIGPDGNYVPGHVFRNGNDSNNFAIGIFDPAQEESNDTPGGGNGGGIDPPRGDELEIIGLTITQENGSGIMTVKGLGTKIWLLQSSDDLGGLDAWESVPGGFTESDNADDSTDLTFFNDFSGSSRRFYRLIESP